MAHAQEVPIMNVEELIAATLEAVIETREAAQPQLSHADIVSQIPYFGREPNEDVISWAMRVDEVQAAYKVTPP